MASNSEPAVARAMREQEVLARTLYAEAREGGAVGMTDVAHVILNRAANPRWWGNSVRSVCLAKRQFSCWWVKDANYRKMLAATDADPSYKRAWSIAGMAIEGRLGADDTKGADHYYAPAGMGDAGAPPWAIPEKLTLERKGHRFYRLQLPAPQPRPAEVPKSYATAAGTTIVGTAVTAAQAMGDLDWRVAIALIVAVGVGFAVWRFALAKRERAEGEP